METWKAIPKSMGFYEASNLGKIRRAIRRGGGTRELSLRRNTNGYLAFTMHFKLPDGSIYRKPWYAHRAVAAAFIGQPEPGQEINHIDGNRQNNSVENLEWVSRKENHAHKFKIGYRRPTRLTKEQAEEAIRLRAGGMTLCEVAKRFGCSYALISLLYRGIAKAYDGH